MVAFVMANDSLLAFFLPGIWNLNSSQFPTGDDITAVFLIHSAAVCKIVHC